MPIDCLLASSRLTKEMSSLWEAETYPVWQDYYLVCYFALLFPLLRYLLDSLVYQKLSRRLLLSNGAKHWQKVDSQVTDKKLPKFTESAWKLTYYFVSELYVFTITYKEPWFGNPDQCFQGWPHQTIKFQLKIFYTYQCGFYIYSIVALLIWETRRKDFHVMMTHHVVSIGLIAFSYVTGFFRIGSVVLALHDVSDIFLESAKLFKYTGVELGASVSFCLFVLSWVLLRLIYFPFWVIRSTSYDSLKYVDRANSKVVLIYYVFNTLLITLLVMHIYWWVLIFRMLVKQLQNKGAVGEDVRSDSDNED